MRLLDLFCGAGGAAKGYADAGFEVVGVDIKSQPNYPYEFHQADVFDLSILWMQGFDAIHASPPCQAYSRATAWTGDRSSHPDLIAPVQALLYVVGLPYVIENVQDARRLLREPVMLCGSMFGVPVQSHRFFEVSPPYFPLVPPCQHRATDASRDHGSKQTESEFRDAMGCGWMNAHEAREAIPPAYTKFLGTQLLDHLTSQSAKRNRDVKP